MPRGNGFTRRGIFGAGAAGAVAAGMSACGDDYFDPATSHGKDVPNVVLIFTDSTRADFIGHYNKHFGYGNRLADTPNLDALGRDSLAFEMAVPEAMPTGPARRGLLTGVRSFPFRNYVPTPGLPVGPGWISIQDNQPIITEVLGEAGVETGYCTDNPFLVGPRFANFRSTVDEIKPSFSQGAYRFLNKPFKRPAPRSAIERYLLPELSDSVEVGRLRSMVGWNSIYRDTDNDYPTARVFRSAINIVDDLKKKRPFFLGADGFDPHEPLDAPKVFQDKYGGPKGIEVTKGITPIQPFETPYSWVIDMKLDPDTIERVRELYAGEIAFTDQWIGRLMNRLADQNLLDETVVIYSSDHGLTLGEQGIVGKHGARAQWHIYHVPFFIRHPEGKLAGQWDPFYASNHDIAKTAMSFMGVRPPGMMTGEDLSVIFDGKRPPPRPHFTSCYDDYVLAGDDEWFFLTDSARFRPQLYDQKKDPRQEHNIADQHPDLVEKYWRILSDEAGGTLPQFSRHGAKPVLGG
jgi:arylsulfatase A-like enzyme